MPTPNHWGQRMGWRRRRGVLLRALSIGRIRRPSRGPRRRGKARRSASCRDRSRDRRPLRPSRGTRSRDRRRHRPSRGPRRKGKARRSDSRRDPFRDRRRQRLKRSKTLNEKKQSQHKLEAEGLRSPVNIQKLFDMVWTALEKQVFSEHEQAPTPPKSFLSISEVKSLSTL